MATDPTPRIRKAGLPSDGMLVVRGDVLDPDVLTEDALRMSRRYPEWRLTGVSAFIASDVGEVDALCESRLALFEVVVVFDRAELERAGIHAQEEVHQ